MNNQNKLKIVAIVLLVCTSIFLISYITMQNSARQPVGTKEESARGSEANETSQQHLFLTNHELLEEKLPTLADTIPDQILQHHYNQTRRLERSAEVIDVTKTNGDTYRMNVIFPASKTSYTVDIEVKNIEVQDYSLSFKEVK